MFRYIFQIDSIEGESARDGYAKGIEIESFHLGYKAPYKRHEIVELNKSDYWPGIICKDVTLHKKYDRSLPPLLMSLTAGQKIEKGTILSFNNQNQVYLTTELEGIMVRRASVSMDKDNILASVGLTYESIVQIFTPENKKSAGIFEFTKSKLEQIMKDLTKYIYTPPEPTKPEPCKQDKALEEAAIEGNPFVQECEKEEK